MSFFGSVWLSTHNTHDHDDIKKIALKTLTRKRNSSITDKELDNVNLHKDFRLEEAAVVSCSEGKNSRHQNQVTSFKPDPKWPIKAEL